jgi:integrase
VVRSLQGCSCWCNHDNEFITEVPLKRWPTIDADNTRERIFSPDELQRLYAVSPRWLENIIRFAVGTGCRQGEILSLTWDQVDLAERLIKLNSSQTKSKYARVVRILPDVEALLRSIPRALHTNRVFLSATGRPIRTWGGGPHRAWAKALREAEISDATFHDLRHTFVTLAMRGGNPSHVVMLQVGHKSAAMLRRSQLVNEIDLQQLQLPDEPNDSARRSS